MIERLIDEIERLTADREERIDKWMELIEEKDERIAKLEAALKPFAACHQRDNPADNITLHDLRMAFEALKEAK